MSDHFFVLPPESYAHVAIKCTGGFAKLNRRIVRQKEIDQAMNAIVMAASSIGAAKPEQIIAALDRFEEVHFSRGVIRTMHNWAVQRHSAALVRLNGQRTCT